MLYTEKFQTSFIYFLQKGDVQLLIMLSRGFNSFSWTLYLNYYKFFDIWVWFLCIKKNTHYGQLNNKEI